MPDFLIFGCPFDPDEKHDAFEEKRRHAFQSEQDTDPLYPFLREISDLDLDVGIRNIGSIPVDKWLRPVLSQNELNLCTVENIISFIDENGCLKMAEQVEEFVVKRVLPNIPCMVSVDHSLTGGAFKAVAEHYYPEDVSLVIMDTHTDALNMSALFAAIQYDLENNPESVYDKNDPFIYNRAESYNASSFVGWLVSNNIVKPENLYLLGVADYPDKKIRKIKDKRIQTYVNAFKKLAESGVTIVTQKECQLKPARIKNVLRKIKTPYLYLSVDMDIGANTCCSGVRFTDRMGMKKNHILRIANAVADLLRSGVMIAGIDFMEINPRKAGRNSGDGIDPTYRIAAEIFRLVVEASC